MTAEFGRVADSLREAAALLEGPAIEAAVGLLIGMLALAMPFRALSGRPQIGWDVVVALVVAVFAVAVEWTLEMPAEFAMARLDGWYGSIEGASWWVVIPAYVVLADFGAYWAHRALHTRWLWPTHAWHHSPKYLYWLSGVRGSPIHFLVLYAPYTVAFVVFPLPEAAVVTGVLLVLNALNQHCIHSNLKLPYPRQLERLLVTPRFHFVHHSTKPSIANSNYGFIFSVWDRIFGTLTDPATVPPDDALGLGYEISTWRLALGLPAPASAPANPDAVPCPLGSEAAARDAIPGGPAPL